MQIDLRRHKDFAMGHMAGAFCIAAVEEKGREVLAAHCPGARSVLLESSLRVERFWLGRVWPCGMQDAGLRSDGTRQSRDAATRAVCMARGFSSRSSWCGWKGASGGSGWEAGWDKP